MKNHHRLKFSAVVVGLILQVSASADLFFTEYVEGSSYNKALEIYNPSDKAVDLSAYSINLFSNGNSTPNSSFPLSGSLESNSVMVVANPKASSELLNKATVTSNVVNFNGNDSITLTKYGAVVDVIGQVGYNPGSKWGSKEISTKNCTIKRKSTVTTGTSEADNIFNPVIEWEGFKINTFSGLGWH